MHSLGRILLHRRTGPTYEVQLPMVLALRDNTSLEYYKTQLELFQGNGINHLQLSQLRGLIQISSTSGSSEYEQALALRRTVEITPEGAGYTTWGGALLCYTEQTGVSCWITIEEAPTRYKTLIDAIRGVANLPADAYPNPDYEYTYPVRDMRQAENYQLPAPLGRLVATSHVRRFPKDDSQPKPEDKS